MNYGGIGGYPATISSGYSTSVPVVGKGVAPAGVGFPGVYGKGVPGLYGKGAPWLYGKGVPGLYGKGVPGLYGKGYPATKAAGFGTVVPATTVATSPFPGAI